MEKCWAKVRGDCNGKISGEHLVSRGILEGKNVSVQGFSWCKDAPVSVGINSITKNCLCQRHNSLLAEVDGTAIRYFDVIDQIAELTSTPAEGENVRAQISGWELERWFIKTLINLSIGSGYRIGPFGEAPDTAHQYLVDVAFGTTSLKEPMGLYTLVANGEAIESKRNVIFYPLLNGDFIGGAIFTLRGLDYFLSLIPAQPPERLGLLGPTGLPDHIANSVLRYRNIDMAWHYAGEVHHSLKIDFT